MEAMGAPAGRRDHEQLILNKEGEYEGRGERDG